MDVKINLHNKLIYTIKQRSQDAIFGFFNDHYWHCKVYERLYNDLKKQVSKIDAKLKAWRPLSTVDNLVGKTTRSALINQLPYGGYINQGYDAGI